MKECSTELDDEKMRIFQKSVKTHCKIEISIYRYKNATPVSKCC